MYSLPSRFHLAHNHVRPGSVGAEVGTFRGEFAHTLLTAKPAKLYLVDTWRAYAAYAADVAEASNYKHAAALRHVQKRFAPYIEAGQVKIVREHSAVAALGELTEPLDWVYLDANHQYEFTFTDLVVWSLRLNPGGFIMGHDYCTRPEEKFGVIKAVDDFCTKFGWRIECITEEAVSSYALRKI